jgi:hypothetical protein
VVSTSSERQGHAAYKKHDAKGGEKAHASIKSAFGNPSTLQPTPSNQIFASASIRNKDQNTRTKIHPTRAIDFVATLRSLRAQHALQTRYLSFTSLFNIFNRNMPAKFYVVKAGRKPGIYHSWDECLAQVRGFKGAACG